MEISIILFVLLLIQSIYFIGWSLLNYARLLSFFSLFNFSFVGIVLVGYLGVVFYNPNPFSYSTISWSLFYAIAIQFCAYRGYVSRNNYINTSLFNFVFKRSKASNKNIFRLGLVYCLLGFYFFYKYYSLPEDILLREHSGLPVLYLVFAKIVYVGYALIMVTALKLNKRFIKRIAIIVFVGILGVLLFRLKRTETLIFICSNVFLLYYIKGYKISRKLLILGGVIFFLFVFYIRELRESINVNFIHGKKINIESVQAQLDQSSFSEKLIGAPELRFAISQIEVSNNNLDFSYGAIHWNRIINLFIPGQIVGRGLKESLLMSEPKYDIYRYYGQETFSTGLMNTILAETFKEFWVFGALFIYFLFNFLRKISEELLRRNDTFYVAFVSIVTPYIVVLSGSGSALYIGGSLFYFFYLIPLRYLK
ncbi:oligosaccharide repeat unit polymerase [Tamlana sp. s12]|uniref:O-antigen polymerase n=1 Tax=Tamlana sp. s12 TaxID=1630406 RepID=UPI0007FD7643|nr:O-antigen polymerase [Tamlana sp. s12]OBQ55585.1 hypothetical protein VQ01_09105 [Tamlana sp. s12]QQY83737.1 oligosaccharide repeat unit polymerase [Tamlana sp. s12]